MITFKQLLVFVIFVLLFSVFPNNSEVMARPGFHPDSPQATAWHPLPNQGLNDNVGIFAVSGDDLYVSEYFTQTGDGMLTNLGHVVRYDTINKTWYALSNRGLDRGASTMTVSGNNLYIGGGFNETGDGSVKNLGNIARYNTNNGTWYALSNRGLNYSVHALLVVGDDLYVGGAFTIPVMGN